MSIKMEIRKESSHCFGCPLGIVRAYDGCGTELAFYIYDHVAKICYRPFPGEYRVSFALRQADGTLGQPDFVNILVTETGHLILAAEEKKGL